MKNEEWKNKISVKKGDFGEEIISQYLISKNLIPYKPHFDGAHPFDFLCATLDKRNMVIADAKAYPRMIKNFEGGHRTGINQKHYLDYLYLQKKYNIPVHLFFIDEVEKKIYGNKLSKLIDNAIFNFHSKTGDKVLFRLHDMQDVAILSKDQVLELKRLTSRNSRYNYGI